MPPLHDKALLPKAIAFAAEVHKEQFDKGGEPYILHCIRVMEDAMRVTQRDRFVGAIAVLHDTMEDQKQYEDRAEFMLLLIDTFGATIARIVNILTKKKGELYLESYIPRVSVSKAATIIKLADLRDNLAPLRQPTLEDHDLQRLQKYHMAYRTLRS